MSDPYVAHVVCTFACVCMLLSCGEKSLFSLKVGAPRPTPRWSSARHERPPGLAALLPAAAPLLERHDYDGASEDLAAWWPKICPAASSPATTLTRAPSPTPCATFCSAARRARRHAGGVTSDHPASWLFFRPPRHCYRGRGGLVCRACGAVCLEPPLRLLRRRVCQLLLVPQDPALGRPRVGARS